MRDPQASCRLTSSAPGPNAAKDAMTNNTPCVAGFETCNKTCAPGGYGFKQINCANGRYTASGLGCVLPSDSAIASRLAGSNVSSATGTTSNNAACTTQWAWARDSDDRYCVCVTKPGYYQASPGWFVWDCQSQWW